MAKQRSAFKGHKKPQHRSKTVIAPAGRWDKFSTTAWLLLPALILVALAYFVPRSIWRNSIENQLSQWKDAYHLNDMTVDRWRIIELEFHGSGNPLTSPISHSQAEIKAHHEQMAALIEPDAGKQFLKDMQTGRWKH